MPAPPLFEETVRTNADVMVASEQLLACGSVAYNALIWFVIGNTTHPTIFAKKLHLEHLETHLDRAPNPAGQRLPEGVRKTILYPILGSCIGQANDVFVTLA